MIGEIIECVLTSWFAFLLKEYIIVSTLFSSRGLQCSELWGLWKWEHISEPSDLMPSSHCRGLFFSCYQVVGRMGLLYGPLHWEDVLTVSIFMASSFKGLFQESCHLILPVSAQTMQILTQLLCCFLKSVK